VILLFEPNTRQLGVLEYARLLESGLTDMRSD
jgi:hypothetical protein